MSEMEYLVSPKRIKLMSEEEMLDILKLFPGRILNRAAGSKLASIRKFTDKKPGQKVLPSPCEWCQQPFGVAAMRKHRPECPKRPKRRVRRTKEEIEEARARGRE